MRSKTTNSFSKMGLFAAFLAAASTTSAFQLLDHQYTRRKEGRWGAARLERNAFRAAKVQCEAQVNGASASTTINKDETILTASALSQELSSSSLYERLNSPERLELNTHAVGGLFDPRKIARYEIYKRLDACEHALVEHNHIVTALVEFGDALDGHPGVVHGGILALALDDIFGFAYEASGVPKAVTANLSLDYRAPTPADSCVVAKVYLERRENRKLYFKGEITSLDGSLVYTESTCLYIIPRSVWEEMN